MISAFHLKRVKFSSAIKLSHFSGMCCEPQGMFGIAIMNRQVYSRQKQARKGDEAKLDHSSDWLASFRLHCPPIGSDDN